MRQRVSSSVERDFRFLRDFVMSLGMPNVAQTYKKVMVYGGRGRVLLTIGMQLAEPWSGGGSGRGGKQEKERREWRDG